MTYSASQLAKRLCGHCKHTLTISGVMGVLFLLPISMYRFRSTSRNSKTRYNFWSAWTISRSLDDVNGGTKRCARHVSSRDVLDDVIVLQFLEKTNLADSCAGNSFVFGFEPDLLESDHLAGSSISRFVNDAICSCGGRQFGGDDDDEKKNAPSPFWWGEKKVK